eukprot:550382_1
MMNLRLIIITVVCLIKHTLSMDVNPNTVQCISNTHLTMNEQTKKLHAKVDIPIGTTLIIEQDWIPSYSLSNTDVFNNIFIPKWHELWNNDPNLKYYIQKYLSTNNTINMNLLQRYDKTNICKSTMNETEFNAFIRIFSNLNWSGAFYSTLPLIQIGLKANVDIFEIATAFVNATTPSQGMHTKILIMSGSNIKKGEQIIQPIPFFTILFRTIPSNFNISRFINKIETHLTAKDKDTLYKIVPMMKQFHQDYKHFTLTKNIVSVDTTETDTDDTFDSQSDAIVYRAINDKNYIRFRKVITSNVSVLLFNMLYKDLFCNEIINAIKNNMKAFDIFGIDEIKKMYTKFGETNDEIIDKYLRLMRIPKYAFRVMNRNNDAEWVLSEMKDLDNAAYETLYSVDSNFLQFLHWKILEHKADTLIVLPKRRRIVNLTEM